MQSFALYNLNYYNPYLSLALDEALCLYAAAQEDFRCGVRLWANPPAVVLGRTNKPEENVNPERLPGLVVGRRGRARSGDIFLCRRASGGGAVLHGPGNINYSLYFSLEAFPELYPVRESYVAFLGMVTRALETAAGVRTAQRGDSDLVLAAAGETTTAAAERERRKISGNAQFRKRGVVVHHGTLLIGDSLAPLIRDVLSHPPKEPEYRAGRSHDEFLSALSSDFDARAFYDALLAEVAGTAGRVPSPWSTLERSHVAHVFKLARKLASGIYVSEDWILRGKVPRP
jgi:lipoate-protein ligase A